MQKQLIALQAELKKTIFFITHDLDESLKLGDHIGILNHGKYGSGRNSNRYYYEAS